MANILVNVLDNKSLKYILRIHILKEIFFRSNSEVELYELSKLITRNDTRIVDDSNRQMFVEVYAALVVACIFFTMLRSASFFKLCMRASQCLHDSMFGNILQAPMKFFDTNPSGRILNRFSKDVGAMDELLPQAMLFMTQVFIIHIVCKTA